MYTEIHVSKFRGLRHAETTRLNRVNLITGLNGAGKTSFLEAIQLHAHPLDASSVLQLDQARTGNPNLIFPGTSTPLPWSQIFGDDTDPIVIEATHSGRTWAIELMMQTSKDGSFSHQSLQANIPLSIPLSTLQMRVLQDGEAVGGQEITAFTNGGLSVGQPYTDGSRVPEVNLIRLSAAFRNSAIVAAQYSQLVGTDAEQLVLEIAQRVDRRIKRLLVWTNGQVTTLHADIGRRRTLELPLISDGLTRVVTAAIGISSCPDGAFLFDEFENGVHYSILTEVWSGLRIAAQLANTQIFATTHSAECIGSAYDAFSGSNDLTLHRIDSDDTGTMIHAFDGEMIDAALSSAVDLR